jgi:hypothetical protein
VGEQEISRTSTFKYLGRVINYFDDDLPVVENHLKKGRKVWARISRIIKKKLMVTLKLCLFFISL